MASIVFLQFVPEIVDWLIHFRVFQRMVSQMFFMNFIVIVHIPAKQYAFSYETWQATKVKAKATFGSKNTMARGSTEKDFNTQVIILWAASWQTPFLCHMRTSEQQRRISACVDASLLFVPTNRQSNNIHIFTTLFPFYELYFFPLSSHTTVVRRLLLAHCSSRNGGGSWSNTREALVQIPLVSQYLMAN